MDESWERGLPFAEMTLSEAEDLFRQWRDAIRVQFLSPIRRGCRNSNHRVDTNQGTYLLRLTPEGCDLHRNEWAIHQALRGRIRMPALHAQIPLARRSALIYEYIPSVSLESLQRKGLSSDVLEQVACLAAALHGSSEVPCLAEAAYPPFETWYRLFADNPVARARLGEERAERVLRLAERKAPALSAIDGLQGLIHGDFRPANMLLDGRGLVYVVDWEYAGKGHTLADIGQFFRYRRFFSPEDEALFERVYNDRSKRPLPPDWRPLSLLRDLVNPLQLLGGAGERPLLQADCLRLIDEDLDALESWE